MIFKKCLQFLDTLCLRLKDKVMFLIGQGYKILRSIIVFDTVKVMNYPTFRQGLTMCLFPNKNMLENITMARSNAWMVRLINEYIATASFTSATFPMIMSRTFYNWFLLTRARVTTLSMSIRRYFFATINAIVPFSVCFPITPEARPTSCGLASTWLAAVDTRMSLVLHNLILSINQLDVK